MCVDCNSQESPAGIDGTNGIYGGQCSAWKFDTSVAATPGSQYLRFNNTTYSSVTNIYINETNRDSTSMAAFLASFSNGSLYGLIRVYKEFDANTFWMGTVTSVTDNGTDQTIGVTYTLHNGAFAANDAVVVCFTPRGNTGATGTAGTAGKGMFVSFVQDPATPWTSINNLQVYTDVATIVFPGTSNVGTFTTIKGAAWVTDNTNAGSFRVYDVTNSQVIAEQTGVTSTSTANIISFTTTPLGNLTTTAAVWKVQAMLNAVDAADYARIGSIALY